MFHPVLFASCEKKVIYYQSGNYDNANSVFNAWVDVEDSEVGRFEIACSLVDEEKENEQERNKALGMCT